ncbi:MAG: GRP family sugar transporter [Chthoniobacterales bacterium]
MSVLYAIITVLAWGFWLVPSQRVTFANERIRTAYVALANLLLVAGVFAFRGGGEVDAVAWLLSFGGGLVWCGGCWAAFASTRRIGIARAMALWAPINILTACGWGALLFGEFLDWPLRDQGLLALGLFFLSAGILLIVSSNDKSGTAPPSRLSGLLLAVVAGVLWGTYFIPLQASGIDVWTGMLPLALGIAFGALLGLGRDWSSLRLPRPSDYTGALGSGLLWSLGNVTSLLLMSAIGTGRGFTIAQLCIVVNALAGIYLLGQPASGSRAAKLTLTGSAVGILGGAIVGNLRS